MTIPIDVQEAGPACVKHYKKCLKNGCAPKMAEMFALRAAPRSMTDDVFLAGRGTLNQQIKDKVSLTNVVRAARKNGYNPRITDYYDPGVARFPGDPEAFFNHGQGRGKLKQVFEQRGVMSDGATNAVSTQAREPLVDPKKPIHKLHPRLVQRHLRQMVSANPDLARKDQKELKHDIINKHGSPKVKE
jgi:hypothetical protein